MKENISIRKNVYSSNKYKEVINTNFSELFSARETFTVEDFFSLYNELFLEIPETGEFSHEALIRKSNQIVTPGNDVKDDEIDNLQSTVEDLQKQLLNASQPTAELEDPVNEHPRFRNGTLIRRFDTSLSGGQIFLMDQAYKRLFDFNDPEIRDSFLRLLEYKNNDGEADRYKVPAFPDIIIDDIPSGPTLTVSNFNDPWSPTDVEQEISELRLTLDANNASLNPDNYNGDFDLFRSELEKDFIEKENYIRALQEKLEDLRKRKQQITGA